MFKPWAVISARTDSKRLPNKCLLPLLGLPAIHFLINRLLDSKKISGLIFATTERSCDDALADLVKSLGIEVYRGSTDDVLGRNLSAIANKEASHLVRITGDCPFVNAETLDWVIEKCKQLESFDLVTTKPDFPHGIDFEVAPISILEKIHSSCPSTEEREHMFNSIYSRPTTYTIIRLAAPARLKSAETDFLLDTLEDYKKINKILETIRDPLISAESILENRLWL